MSSPYAKSRGGGGSPYAQNRGGGGSAYSKPRTQSSPAEPSHSGGHGFFHRFGSDLLNAAESSPAGVAAVGKALVQSGSDIVHNRNNKPDPTVKLLKGIGRQTVDTVKHPLRHPGDTALLALPFIGGAGKVVEAGAVAKAGGTVGDVAKTVVKGAKGPRELDVNGLKVRGHYSNAAGARVMQKATDRALEKGAAKSVRVENVLHRRAARFQERNQRTADSVARIPGTTLATLGHKLKPEELRALRLVAEETPVERRIAAQELRKGRATNPKEIARHQERIDLNRGAQKYLTPDESGKPMFKPEAVKLQKVFGALKTASTDRESMLKQLGLLDEQAQGAARTKVARVAAGAQVTKKGEVVGATDISASPDAVFVGNPVERTKLRGKPKVSSTGTFGHTQKPSSLKTSTGGSVEHALERNDVTKIVAERHTEAVRLAKIQRVAKTVSKAGEKVPRRPDDVWVWTDKTVSNERIPKEVRQYLDNPEALQQLAPDKQHSLMEKVKEAHFERHDWKADPESRTQFEKLATQGKGVFVPRRLMGTLAKREDITLPGSHFVDAVNNAQKAGLVYLKVNYPIIQAVSNTAMNLIQQGFAFPRNITAAIRLEKKVGPEYAAITDDIMGQGAIVQAQFEGQGTVARATQKVADVMSSKVDTPARRAAFYHEAVKAGYGTPERYRALLTDPEHLGDLGEVAQRAREAIVDYGDLSPFERSVVRRLIFVYPWQKGATKYAGHFVRDHPLQAAVVGQLGQAGAQANQDKLGDVPTYLRGAFDVNGGLVNPSGVNFFQTPGQIGEAVAGLATGNPAERGAGLGFLAPAPAILAGLASGHDDIGRPLASNVLGNIRDLTYGQTPVSAIVRALGGNSDAIRKGFGSRTNSQSFPDTNDAFYRFLVGGLYPRKYDKPSLNKNAALQKTGR